MKHFLSFRAIIALLLFAGAIAGSIFAKPDKNTTPPEILLAISAPPMWDSLREADIIDAFQQRVVAKLHKAGFDGEIGEFDAFEKPDPAIPVIELHLMHWRPERTGSIVCTFSANLKTADKNQNLGIFTGTAPQWMTTASHTWELRRGLDDSANRALENLVRKLRSEEFLPPAKKDL